MLSLRAGSPYPLARGCRRIWRGEIWKYGFGRRDAARPARAAWRWTADLDLLILGPRVYLICSPYAREGADGQAVVCPLLRGSSPTQMGRAKTASGSRACFHSGISGWFSYLARGCRRICRGEIWKYGFGRRDAARPASGRLGGGRRDLDLMILGPRVYLYCSPYAREGADGQAVVCPLLRGSSPTRGVAPKQHRVLGRAFTPAGSLSLILARGCRRICRGEIWKYGFGRRDAARGIGPPGVDGGFRFNDFGGPAFTLLFTLTRARALMARPWSARCYGVARPRRWVAPKQHRGLGRAFSPAFRAGSLIPGAWVPKNLARRSFGLLVSADAMLLERIGPPGRWTAASLDLLV